MKTKLAKQIVRFFPLLLILLCLVFIYFEYDALSLLNADSVNGNQNIITLARKPLLISMIGFSAVLIFCIAYFYLIHYRQLKALTEKLKSVAEKDAEALQQGLSELAYGNLTSQIKIESETIGINTNGLTGELFALVNKLIFYLKESGKEFNSATDEPCQRLFYVGADSYLEGRKSGEVISKILNGKGKVIVAVRTFSNLSQELRRKGLQSFLHENSSGIFIADSYEMTDDPLKVIETTKAVLKKHPDADAIYVTNAGGADVAKAVKELGIINRVKIVSHDVVSGTMQSVIDGSISAAIGQDGYGQGFNSVIYLFNAISSGWRSDKSRLLTNMDVVDNKNYQNFWQPGRGIIENNSLSASRPKPIAKASKQVRIAVIGRFGNELFDQIKQGVDAAAHILSEYNAKVDWIIPNGYKTAKGFDAGAKVFGAAIDECIVKKYDGICVGIYDKNLVNHVNKAVGKGILVCTYNSEPLSLRGLLQRLNKRTKRLMTISDTLMKSVEVSLNDSQANSDSMKQISDSLTEEATSVNAANTNMIQIQTAIETIAKDSHTQKLAADNVSDSAYQISKVIESVKVSSSQVVKSSLEAIDIAQNGTSTVQNNLEMMRKIEALVKSFADKMEMLAKRSNLIEDIIKTIDEISGQTNLLALNAAIEAARAGEAGRGFAIVADEVKNLSEKSASATKQTSDLISGIKRDILDASDSIKEIVIKVKEGASSATNSGVAIEKLLETSKLVSHQVENVSVSNSTVAEKMNGLLRSIDQISEVIDQNMSATEELSTGVKQTVEMINNIALLSDFNSATLNDISSKIEKSTNEFKGLNNIAEDLTGMANELQAGIVQFKIDKE